MRIVHASFLAAIAVACRSTAAPDPRPAPAPRATLGVTTAVPPSALASAMQLELEIRQEGRLVESVDAGSAAEEAGIRTGDVLLRLDGVTLYSQDDLDDVLSVHRPGEAVTATVVRAGTDRRDELSVALGAGAARATGGIDWQYASLVHLPSALRRAAAEKKKVLVGLSGAETWWPSTRFEGGALSQVLNDPAVVRATEPYVRILVRRPHAYRLLDETFAEEGGIASATPAGCVSGEGTVLPLPGLYVLGPEGRFVAATAIGSVEEVVEMLQDPGPDGPSGPEAEPESSAEVSIQVSGFQQAEGITWHGWPNRVQEALDGLPGVHAVAVDLAEDRFDVEFDPGRTGVEDLLQAIRALDYDPRVVDAPGERPAAAARIDPGSLPADVLSLFDEARASGKLVLVELSGPGWVSCERMDAVTYPDPDVKRELSGWLVRRVDVVAERGLATAFEVAAVPTAVALDASGRVVDRIVGFVAPADFLARLARARGDR